LNETILTIAIIFFIASSFWLIRKIEEKGPIFKDRGFVQIRNMLRKILLPLGFDEHQTHALGSTATSQRDTLLVELYFDYRDKEYSLFAHDVQDPVSPPRLVSITFRATQYNSEKKKAIRDALQAWIETTR